MFLVESTLSQEASTANALTIRVANRVFVGSVAFVVRFVFFMELVERTQISCGLLEAAGSSGKSDLVVGWEAPPLSVLRQLIAGAAAACAHGRSL